MSIEFARSRRLRRVAAVSLALTLLCTAATASAQGARYAMVVQGASGEEQYAVQHRRWVDSLVRTLRDRFKYDAAHLLVLTEKPGAGEARADAATVRSALARLTTSMTTSDQLILILIGHGSGQGSDLKFNLMGPDLSVAEWATLLAPVPGRLAVVNTTSASFPFIGALAGPGRVVITATNANAQRYHTVFPEGFVEALASDAADTDKNSRISLLEAFTYANRVVAQHYERSNIIPTETAALDDDGDGKPRTGTAEGTDGTVAGLTYLDAAVVATSADPEVQKLLARQQALTEQVDDLRRRQGSMPAAQFDSELEKLLTELAVVSRQVREREKK
jgi:hypothetical protein